MPGIEPLTGKQAASAALADHRLNLWEGAVRSSKTVSSLLAWLRYVRTGPAGNLVMVGKTERTLKRNTIDPLIDLLGAKRCRYVAGAGELWLLGRRVYTAGANDAKAEAKIRGLTLAGAYVDEVSLLPHGYWSMLLTRLSVDGARLFGTTNPDNPLHWLNREVLKRARTHLTGTGQLVRSNDPDRLDLARFTFRLTDNPHLSADYIAALEAEFSGLWYRRFILGEWCQAEGVVFDRFDPAVMVVDQAEVPVDRIDQWCLAIDYGTTNPLSALLLGVDPGTVPRPGDPGVPARLWVAAEWRWSSKAERRQLTDAEYSQALRRWLTVEVPDLLGLAHPPEVERLYVDPSAASFSRQLWVDGWRGVTPADNAVEDGIRSVASLMAADRLRIAGAEPLVEELAGYSWDAKAAAKGEDRPLKVDDHGPDALRYGVRGLAGRWRSWLTSALPDAA